MTPDEDSFVLAVPQYEKDVLVLHDRQVENDLDEDLLAQARSLGLEPTTFSVKSHGIVDPASPVAGNSSSPRRGSEESILSSSTGFASTFSRSSQDTTTHASSLRLRSGSRPSLYAAEHDRLYDAASPSSRSSLSLSRFSPPSSIRSPSTTHIPQETSQSPVRRGLARLSRLRNPDPAHGGEGRTSSSSSRRHTVIAGLAQVLARKDDENAQGEALEFDHRARSPGSVTSGYITRRSTPHAFIASRGASPYEISVIQEQHRMDTASHNLERVMQHPNFQSLRRLQAQQRDAFLTFVEIQRPLVFARASQIRAQKIAAHPQTTHDLNIRYSADVARLEDRHVVAEMDIREAHELEQRNVHIALRHMEAYCRGDAVLGDPQSQSFRGQPQPQRTVTAQDRRNLERQYWLRDRLPQKHESAINVLREQQARQLRVRAAAYEAERERMARTYAADLGILEDVEGYFEAWAERARERLVWRWELARRIWVVREAYELPLPGVKWEDV